MLNHPQPPVWPETFHSVRFSYPRAVGRDRGVFSCFTHTGTRQQRGSQTVSNSFMSTIHFQQASLHHLLAFGAMGNTTHSQFCMCRSTRTPFRAYPACLQCVSLTPVHWEVARTGAVPAQVMFQNRTGKLALVDLYYEWGRGRNANLIHAQQGSTLYDIGACSCQSLSSGGAQRSSTQMCKQVYLGEALADPMPEQCIG